MLDTKKHNTETSQSQALDGPCICQGKTGGAPTSVHTLHQPGIFPDPGPAHPAGMPAENHQEILPWSWGAHRPLPGFSHDDIKDTLADSLEKIGCNLEALNVRSCQKQFYVVPCSRCGLPVAYANRCRNRLCPDCAAAAADLLINEHSELLKQIRYPRIMTLTWPSVKHLDRECFIEARADLVKLRHRKIWSSVFGGIGSFEVTYNDKHGWHLHWHALIGSGYIPQDELAETWEKISGARVVDIRAVKNKNKWDGIREVVKYPAKSAGFLDRPELVKEYLEAVKGLKLVTGFGSLYRVQTRKRADGKLVCPRCGSILFDWRDKISVSSDRVIRYGNAWVLDLHPGRAGP